MTIEDFQGFAFEISPPWLRRRLGERMVGVIAGLLTDSILEGFTQAVQAPWLRSGFQPPDALPPIGSERSMPRYEADTDETYRTRLHDAWDSWQQGGNEAAIIGQLNAFGLANVTIIPAVNGANTPGRDEFSFEEPPTIVLTDSFRFDSIASGVSGTNPEIVKVTVGTFEAAGVTAPTKVLFDTPLNGRVYARVNSIVGGSTLLLDTATPTDASFDLVDEGPIAETLDFTNWSRFIVIIEDPNPYDSWAYGDGFVYDDDSMTYGSTATVGDISAIKSIIRKWKAGHTINPLIMIILTEGPFYADGSDYGDVGLVYSGTLDAIFIDHQ